MSRSFAEITQDALRLPQQDQLRSARTLLESSEAVGDLEVEAAWEEEIERRIKMVDSGLIKGRPFADVVEEVGPPAWKMNLLVLEPAGREFIESAAYYEAKEAVDCCDCAWPSTP